jgi:hypothetical protein
MRVTGTESLHCTLFQQPYTASPYSTVMAITLHRLWQGKY